MSGSEDERPWGERVEARTNPEERQVWSAGATLAATPAAGCSLRCVFSAAGELPRRQDGTPSLCLPRDPG